MGEIIFIIIFCAVISFFIMVGASVLFAVLTAVAPFLAIIMICLGIFIGLITSLKNAFLVYKQIYFKRRR